MNKILGFLAIIYALAVAVAAIYSYPVVGTIAIGSVLWLAVIIKREMGRKERELAQQGFHVEYVSPGILRAGPDDFAIVYHDLRGQIWFNGTIINGKSILSIPSPNAWETKVPDWAKDQKQIIIERISQAYPKVVIQ